MPSSRALTPIPPWLRLSGAGVLLLGITAVAQYAFRRGIESRALGTMDDPFPPADEPPPKEHFTYPAATPLAGAEASAVVRRQWARIHGSTIGDAGLGLLLAQAAVSTDRGASAVSNNPINRRADRFWRGAWTVRREPEWADGRPLHRWAAIRAYGSWDAGVGDWIGDLSEDAASAIANGDAEAFAAALEADGWGNAPPGVFGGDIVGMARRIALGKERAPR